MGSAQLRTRRPKHLGRIIRSAGTGLSGLTLEAGLSGPDYWESPGPIPSVARGGLQGGPDYPGWSGRIIRPEPSASSAASPSCVRFLLRFHASVLLVLDSNTSLTIFSSCLRFLRLFQASVLVVLSSITPLAPSRVIMHEERFLATQGAFGSNGIPFTCVPMES